LLKIFFDQILLKDIFGIYYNPGFWWSDSSELILIEPSL